MYLASEHDHLDIVKYLISEEEDGEGQDDDRKMAFHVAVQYGHLDIVKYLISEEEGWRGSR